MTLGSKRTKNSLFTSWIHKITNTLADIFQFNNLKASFNVAFKEREEGMRHIIVLLIFLFSVYMLCGIGLGIVDYPYAREMFDWESTDYFRNWWSTYCSGKVRLTKWCKHNTQYKDDLIEFRT